MRPFCVSGGMRSSTRPLSVRTGTSPPSSASRSETWISRVRSAPLRVKSGWRLTLTRSWTSPPPGAMPEKRIR